MQKLRTKTINYKGFKVEQGDGDYLAFKRGDLVAGEDTLKRLKHVLDEMIRQGVSHESELRSE